MATKLSVTTSSAPSSASRASDAGMARNSATGAPPASGFSSAMSAANRPREADNSNHDTDRSRTKSAPPASSAAKTNANTSANGNKQSTTPKSSAANSTASADDSSQDSSGAAVGAQSDVSLIDSNVATADGKTDRSGAKSRTGSTGTSATLPSDPAALALMLAASGMQVDGRAGSGQQSNGDDSKDTSSDADSSSSEAIAAGAMAASIAVGSLATEVASAGTTSASVPGTTSTSQPATHSDAAMLIALESDPTGSTLNNASVLDTGAMPPKSGMLDAAQSAPSVSPIGLPDLIRGMASGPLSSSVERSITTPVSDRNWSGAVAGQIQWMVNSNVQNATLQLSPDHLGPLEVHIDMQSSQVNVTFSASHADTRAALEQSVPRLREIMASGGLTLGQTSVQQETSSGSQYKPSVSRSAISMSQSVDPVSVSSIRALGLIDEYA